MKSTHAAGLVLGVLLAAGCQKAADTPKSGEPAAQKEYDIRGKVVDVSVDRKTVTLDHEEIPGLMKAMTMKYAVEDPKVLEGIATGDDVQGRLRATGGDYTITRLGKR
jgi:Cu/Ag efflux protein CusF